MTQTPDRPPRGAVPVRQRSWWPVVAPALTLVVGILLGIAVAGAGNVGGSSAGGPAPTPSASTETSASATPSPTSSDLLVRVPAACLDLANRASGVLGNVGAVASAARDLDARALAEALTALQDQQSGLQNLADRCRAAAGSSATGGGLVSPAPSAT